MARPLNDPVLQAATSTGASRTVGSRAHRTHTLFVSANDPVSGTIEIRLEGSPNGDDWATIQTLDGNVTIDSSDFNSNGNAMQGTGACAIEHLRANVVQNTDSISFDIWIMSTSNGGPARRGGAAGEP